MKWYSIYIVRVFINYYKLYAQLGSHLTGFSWCYFLAIATTTNWILAVSSSNSCPSCHQLLIQVHPGIIK
jgi:hypothetical protein